MIKLLRPAIVLLFLFSILTGVIYPAVVTSLAQMVFPRQANGSLIEQEGILVGSVLIGQPFSDPKYFWGRLSATASFPYNAAASSGSNFGPSNPALTEAAQKRIQALKDADREADRLIPIDLVTASASGLDPHISVAAAYYQAGRVARQRGLSETQVRELVDQYTEPRFLGLIGEARVNVLKLNLALDGLQ